MMYLKEFEKAINDFKESEVGIKYLIEEKLKTELLEKRFFWFEEWLKNNDFDNLMLRLIYKHDEDYREKCYHKGLDVMPNNVLDFIIRYVETKVEPIVVQEISCEFPNCIWLFKGYYFQVVYGQGCFYRIYNKEDLRILLTV